MSQIIVLDAGVLSLATQRAGVREADNCRQWIAACLQAGKRIVVPAIANYEVRRELLRARKTASVLRLDRFLQAAPDCYLLLTDEALMFAAQLWAQARQQGIVTADPKALDADVILAAQARLLEAEEDEVVVATSNVRHLSHFVTADLWTNIAL